MTPEHQPNVDDRDGNANLDTPGPDFFATVAALDTVYMIAKIEQICRISWASV